MPVTYISWASSEAARATMTANRGRNTAPELRVRSRLHRAGLRFRVNVPVPGLRRRTVDIVFPRQKIAVFVDGCYWHGCHVHRSLPQTNRDFWSTKIADNVRRDAETTAHLEALGWTPLRFWEHEALDDVVARIVDVVRERR